jgi:hypothetical protein
MGVKLTISTLPSYTFFSEVDSNGIVKNGEALNQGM